MNRDPILFRVDGTTQSGWERLHRCLVYAAALQRRRRPTFFLSQLEPASLALNIKRFGNTWLEADSPAGTKEDLAETIQEIRRLRPAAVVVDAPTAAEEYLEALTRTGSLIVSFDSLANIRFPSDLIVNPLLGPTRESYEFEPGAQLLLGARYALVPSHVRRVRPIRAQDPAQPAPNCYRAMVALGDDDPNEQVEVVTDMLLAISKLAKIDVVVRSQHPHLEQLRAKAARLAGRLSVVTEPSEIAARLSRCHFAITAGNGTSLELACIGMPQLLIVQSEAHWPNAQRLEEEGAATCLGGFETVSESTVRQAVLDLVSDPLERQAMMRCGRKLIDGRGPDRLVTALEVMLHPSRQVGLAEAA
ncbi:MAG: hypothetical protein KatS3mg105_1455 [Gemmatales bacterium]|nr:MAG: hypothetical protein KatS3mg105_1455 [Gemmatales bacterium]